MDDHRNEAQLIGAGSDDGTFVLLKSHQGHTSQSYSIQVNLTVYKSILQFREKHPQAVAPPPPQRQLCPQYVPVEMLCFSVSIRGRGHQLDSTKSDFHPT